MDYINMKGEHEFVLVTAAEKAERNKLVMMERHYFRKAQFLAAREWDLGDYSLKYPGGSFRPPEMKQVSFHARESDGLKHLRKQIERQEQQADIRERNEKNKENAQRNRNRYNRGSYDKEEKDIYARQRAVVDEGYALLMEKMEELMGKGDAPGARTLPEDVGGFGQP